MLKINTNLKTYTTKQEIQSRPTTEINKEEMLGVLYYLDPWSAINFLCEMRFTMNYPREL
jgi:hypothetical protein